jgi:hypothetical protein
MERTMWDLYSKLVVAAGLAETLRHAGVDLDAATLVAQPTDLPANARTADLVFATSDGRDVVHVEIQQRPDPTIGRRMLGYGARIVDHPDHRDRMRHLIQVVVQVTGSRPMDTRFSCGWLSNSCALVHIPSIPVADLVATPGLAPFAMVGGGADAVPLLVQRMSEVDATELRLAMLGLAVNLDPASSDAIMEQLRRDHMTDVIDELRRTEWGRGLIAEGREEGREETRLADVLDVLRARFADAPQDVVTRAAHELVRREGAGAVRAALTLSSI